MNFFIVYNNVVVVVAAAAIIFITLFGLSSGEKPEHSVSLTYFFILFSIIYNQMQICFSQITLKVFLHTHTDFDLQEVFCRLRRHQQQQQQTDRRSFFLFWRRPVMKKSVSSDTADATVCLPRYEPFVFFVCFLLHTQDIRCGTKSHESYLQQVSLRPLPSIYLYLSSYTTT